MAAYVPDWEPLAAALKRIKAHGVGQNQAKLDLCRAIADHKISIRVRIASADPLGGRVCDSHHCEVEIPPHLDPSEFDWNRSRPQRAWPTRIQMHQHFSTQWDRMQRHLDLIELFVADVTDVLCLGKDDVKQPAEQSRTRIRPARERAERAIKARYPDDIPDPANKPNTILCREVGEWLKSQNLRDVSDDTILRAAGRRK